VLSVDREIVDLLRKRYPEAYDLLLDLAVNDAPAGTVAHAGGIHGPGARALRNFGLLEEATLRIPEHLSWYVKTLVPARVRLAV